MNLNHGEIYEVYDLRGVSQLDIDPPYDLKSARAFIDWSNRKAVNLGYSAKQWLIVKKQYNRASDDNGQFIMSTVVRVAVEKYPAELKEE